MLRVTEIERSIEHEVYDIRFVEEVIVAAAMLLGLPAFAIWFVVREPNTGSVALAGWIIALWLLIVWLVLRSWRVIRLTVSADQVLVVEPNSRRRYSYVVLATETGLSPRELFIVTSSMLRQTGITPRGLWSERVRRYHLVTSETERTLAAGIDRRATAERLAELVNGSLARLRESPPPDADELGNDP
jgi:hypothetical protein